MPDESPQVPKTKQAEKPPRVKSRQWYRRKML
jgi:ribosomal protein S30